MRRLQESCPGSLGSTTGFALIARGFFCGPTPCVDPTQRIVGGYGAYRWAVVVRTNRGLYLGSKLALYGLPTALSLG
jgi:hypothetical protein